ncbi:hypothetical protein ACFPVX_09465 [Cohnella faecalis]|uniref:Uncharacterized protein n=1 Tax=Cohnella faecalis TaxID=2315694 RepID=A0A398CM95_9BACL|nr:hypothetical protein [Cohnella faecalis]RIE01928.1 hypothetical protein D3H35_14230 [Cohnella faecalis]
MSNLWIGLELAGSLLGSIIAWISGAKASRLLYSGSAERLHRKSRKLLVWTVLCTLPSLVSLFAILMSSVKSDTLFGADRILLHLPLIGVPLLALWLVTAPGAWRLWKQTKKLSGCPLPLEVRRHSAAPGLIVPFQALALNGVAVCYFSIVPPVPWSFTRATVSLLIFGLTALALWKLHDKRLERVIRSNAALASASGHTDFAPALREYRPRFNGAFAPYSASDTNIRGHHPK